MSTGGSIETIGDNREFTVINASDVTVYFNGGSDGTKTSADDTATERYYNNNGTVKAFTIRPEETIQIVSMNGTTFADPITVIKNTVYTEKFDTAAVVFMVIRTALANTHVRIRMRNR